MTNHFDPASYAGIPLDQTRRQVGEEIERMIAFLDWLEGDADLEDEPDSEESLGWTVSSGPCTANRYVSPVAALCDLEGDEHDGREPDVCGEHGIGWTGAVDQDGPNWNPHDGWGQTDREYDPAESGIADEGGLQEQFACFHLDVPDTVYVRPMEGVL